ncbi:MAG: CAF17-like 4Fe-4S cluster assembly/insertion protein YgfZ [Actinomycetota bacterium]
MNDSTLVNDSTWTARPPRDVVVAAGPDALSFLQSLVSADLDGLADGQSVRSLLLTPQGKLEADFHLARVGDDAWLICEGGFGEQLVAALERFKIRVKVDIDLRPDLAVLAVRVPPARADGDDVVVVPVPWPDGDRFDIVGPTAAVEAAETELAASGVAPIDADTYEALRVDAGIPRMGFELGEKTIPQEAFLDRDAVSFSKGCFLGQELVCRIDTRGHVNKYLRRLTHVEGDVPPDAEIMAGDKVVGAVTSAASGVALGYVRREIEPPADVTLRWDGGEASATVTSLPLIG